MHGLKKLKYLQSFWIFQWICQEFMQDSFADLTIQLTIQRTTTAETSWYHFWTTSLLKCETDSDKSIVRRSSSLASSALLLSVTQNTDLLSPQLLATEFRRWKSKFALMSSEMRPGTLQTALQHCDADAFPNIRELLLIACTLPVTVCENER